MRTTLDIDAPVLEAARRLATATNRSLGAVISDLATRGLHANAPAIRSERALPVFDVPPHALPLDPAAIRALIENDGLPD